MNNDFANFDAQFIFTGTLARTLANDSANIDALTFKELFIHPTLRNDFSTILAHSSVTWTGTWATTLAGDSFQPGPSLIYDSFAATDSLAETMAAFASVTDTMALADTPFFTEIYVLTEQLLLSESLPTNVSAFTDVAESLGLHETVIAILVLILQESVLFSDAEVDTRVAIGDLADSLVLDGVVATQAEALSLISLTLALTDALNINPENRITESLVLTDAFTSVWSAYQTLVDMLVLTDSATSVIMVTNALVDTMNLTTSTPTVLRAQELLVEALLLDPIFIIDGVVYHGWVLNTETNASTRYENYPFNSMAVVGNLYFAANEDGLFQLGGSDDDGSPIVSSMLTGKLDFNSPNFKNVRDAYIGYTSAGRIILKVVTTQAGVEKQRYYELKGTVAGKHREGRIALGRGIQSLYWQFELVNPDGDDFEIDQANFEVIRLSRRV